MSFIRSMLLIILTALCYPMILANSINSIPSSFSVENLSFKAGDRWSYENRSANTDLLNRTWVETVKSIKGRQINYGRVDTLYNGTIEPEIFESRTIGQDFFAFPLSVGKQWSSPNKERKKVVGTINYRVLLAENVTIKAGSFDALKIAANFSYKGKRYQQIFWFSPAVKAPILVHYMDGSSVSQITELTSFDLK